MVEHCCSSWNVSKMRNKIKNYIFSCYLKTASKLLNNLNIVFSGDAFEHIFFRYRPFVDCNNETLNLKCKMKVFCSYLREALWNILTQYWRLYLKKRSMCIFHLKYQFQAMTLLTSWLISFPMNSKKETFYSKIK